MPSKRTVRIIRGMFFMALLFVMGIWTPARAATVVIYSSTDTGTVLPLIKDFERIHPDIRVDYQELDSVQLYERFLAEAATGGSVDVLWSSAMDLQVKLVNDGHALIHTSAETAALPAWANWRNEAFGTSYEPICIAYNPALFAGGEAPTTHFELLHALQKRAGGSGEGRVITYDPGRSGLGFLLHSQDSQANPSLFWGLVQAMGDAGLRSYATTRAMLDQLSTGKADLAYNILGSYAMNRARQDPRIHVAILQDYTLVMSRVAFIARNAPHPQEARLWLDYLLSERGQRLLARNEGLYAVREGLESTAGSADLRQTLGRSFRPIALGPGLLTYQDQIKKQSFLARWAEYVARP